jgi:hypothetical protein
VFTCSFSDELLASVVETNQLDDPDRPPASSDVFRCKPATMRSLRRRLRDLCAAVRSDPAITFDPCFTDSVTRELPQRFVAAIAGSSATNCRLPIRQSRRHCKSLGLLAHGPIRV